MLVHRRSALEVTIMQTFFAPAAARAARFAAVALGLWLPTTGALGQVPEDHLKSLAVVELKSLYLACERAAMQGMLGHGDARYCSVAYEELKRRGFGGDFEKLLTWWRARGPQKAAAP
jgi:hypothetical protein